MLKLSLEKDSFADTPQDLVHVSVCAVCPTKSLIAVASGSSSSSGGRGEKQKREEGVPKIMMYRFGQEEWKLVREERVPQGAGLGEGGDHTSSKQRPLTRLEIMKQQLILKRQEQLQKTGGTGAPTGTGSLAAGSVCNGSASHVTATSLAWRPDGMALACGHSNGTCTIYSPEQSGSWTPSETQSKEAVVSLFWSLSPLEDRKQATLFQQTLYQGNDDGDGTLTGAGHGKKRLQGSEKDKEFPYAWDSLDLLFCLDKKWTVFVFSCGQFLVGKISCGTILGPEIASITPAHIQYSSELMHGIVSGHKASENSESEGKRSGSPTKQTGMNVVTFSLQGLVKKKRFVARVSRSMWRISTEATNVHAIVERCVTTWKKVNDLFTQRTEKLSSLLEEHGSLRSPEEDLLAFLAVGELSPAMEQFVPVDIRTFHAGIEKGIWAVLSALRFELPGLLEKFYLFVLEAQKGDQSRRFSGLDVPIKELSKKVRDLGETVSALNTALLKQFKWLENCSAHAFTRFQLC